MPHRSTCSLLRLKERLLRHPPSFCLLHLPDILLPIMSHCCQGQIQPEVPANTPAQGFFKQWISSACGCNSPFVPFTSSRPWMWRASRPCGEPKAGAEVAGRPLLPLFSRLQFTEHKRHTKARCFREGKKRGECRGQLNHFWNLSGGGGRAFWGRWVIVVFSRESFEANFYIIVELSFILFPGARGCSSVVFPRILRRSFVIVPLLWYIWSSSWWVLTLSVAVATHLLAVAVPIFHSFHNLLFVDLINYLEQKGFFKSASQRMRGQRFWEEAFKHFLITELQKVCYFHVWGSWLHVHRAAAVLGDRIFRDQQADFGRQNLKWPRWQNQTHK